MEHMLWQRRRQLRARGRYWCDLQSQCAILHWPHAAARSAVTVRPALKPATCGPQSRAIESFKLVNLKVEIPESNRS